MNEYNRMKFDLNAEPPVEEPARQYYFMEKAHDLVAEISKEAGRKLSFCVTTFGCQMNTDNKICA